MGNKHTVIIVTGLDSPAWQMWPIVAWWKTVGMNVIVFDPKWKNRKGFEEKLKKLLNLIDEETSHSKVSLVGISAGGSAVINAYLKRVDKVHCVVTVCSQLKLSHHHKNSTLKKSKSFKESVVKLEKNTKKLTVFEKTKILNIRSLLIDELVPKDTSFLNGTEKVEIPTEAHVLTIVSALTVFSFKIIRFIRANR